MAENTEKSERKAVFLDTEVFNHLNHDYTHRDLCTLNSLVEDGQVRVVLTTITRSEVLAHINQGLEKAIHDIKKAVGRHRILRNFASILDFAYLDSDEVLKKMQKEGAKAFAAFCRDCQATFLDTVTVNPEDVFQDYFNNHPPFGPDRKKPEFPDAFVAGALRKWCEKEDQGLYAISADADWKAICEGDKRLICLPSLAAFLELFPDAALVAGLKAGLRSRWEEVDRQIGEVFVDLSFYLEETEGVVERVEVIETNAASLFVVEAQKGDVVFEVECEVAFEASVRYEVPGSCSHYGDARDMYPDEDTGRVKNRATVTAEIKASYDESQPEILDELWVSLYDSKKEIGVSIKRLLYWDDGK